MIITPKTRGFICTTAHPEGCKANVKEQITYTQQQTHDHSDKTPKRVLVIGASSGYGLSSRITAAFGYNAATVGVFFEKPATVRKPGTAGWHNSEAFDHFAKEAGLYSKSVNGDAFSHEAKNKVVEIIKKDLKQVDLVVYSLASPVRKDPDTGEVFRSVLKPLKETYQATAIDTNKDSLFEASIEPATQEEVAATVKVMGGDDWNLWIQALFVGDCLAPGCQTVSYSYIGTEITWPIYWQGALGVAKKDLDHAAKVINSTMASIKGSAHIAVLKSVVTQASAAIPVMPLYIAIVYKKMREEGFHEGCIEQINRLFHTKLYNSKAEVDHANRFRLDDWELQDSIQEHCKAIWPQLTDKSINELTDYKLYKKEFLKLFGFGVSGIDYQKDVILSEDYEVVNV